MPFSAKSGRNGVPERRFDFLKRKGHRASHQLKLVVLVKLNKSEIDLAGNHGTMPPSCCVGFGFVGRFGKVGSKTALQA